MDVVICATEKEAGEAAGRVVADIVRDLPAPVIGVATGSSPLGLYQELARQVEAGELDLTNGEYFALDEYLGLSTEHPESYYATINRTVTVPLKADPNRVHVPRGLGDDLDGGCADYEKAIVEAGGVDVQILGIGANGHLGFNEPGSSFASRTRVEALTRRTIEANARFFDGDDSQVPTACVTQGLGTIMEARHLVLVALGEGKADAVACALEGPVTVMCPASIMQHHPNVTVVVDEAAASKLQQADFYRAQVALKQQRAAGR